MGNLKCALCGNIMFTNYYDYECHSKDFHNIKMKVIANKTTQRTSKEITAEVEKRLGINPLTIKTNISPVKAKTNNITSNCNHNIDCVSDACFRVKFDDLVKKSEEVLWALQEYFNKCSS